MTDTGTLPGLTGGIESGGGVGTVLDQSFAMPFLVGMAIAVAVGVVVEVGY